MTYTMTVKRRIRDLKIFNFDRAIKILTLRNQGWTLEKIGKETGLSKVRVGVILKRMGNMTVEQAEKCRDDINKLPIYKHKK